MCPIPQHWPRPSRPRPIVILGCGGIVNDAHLPAYAKAKLPVAGVFDIDRERCETTAKKWNTRAFDTLERAVAEPEAVFDIAVPPEFEHDVLAALPNPTASCSAASSLWSEAA